MKLLGFASLLLLVVLVQSKEDDNSKAIGDAYPAPDALPFRKLMAFRPQPRPTRPSAPPSPTTTQPPPTTSPPPTKASTRNPPTSSPPTTQPPPTTAKPTSPPPTTQPPSPPPTTTTTTKPAASDWKVALLNAVNNERAKVNLAPLCLTSKLIASAQGHATDMATNNYFNHNSQDGTDPFTRIRRQGYIGGSAENIAAGYTTVEDVMTGWMNLPGHRANILSSASQLGVGMAYNAGSKYGYYWVQNFGTSSTEPCV